MARCFSLLLENEGPENVFQVTFPLKSPQDVTGRYGPLSQSQNLSVFWVKNDVFRLPSNSTRIFSMGTGISTGIQASDHGWGGPAALSSQAQLETRHHQTL